MKRLLSAIVIVLFFLSIGYILLIYATGKRLTREGNLVGVGIVQIDGTPDNSRIFVNNEFKDEADANLENLRPGKYSIRLEKENYHPWQKEIEVLEGKVIPLKVKLFPSNPSLTAATFNGVYSPKISLSGNKIAFGIQTEGKKGIWVLDLTDRQFFFSSSTLRQLIADTSTFTYSQATFVWSPNNDKILVEVKNNSSNQIQAFELEQDQLNTNPKDLTSTATALKKTWSEQVAAANLNKLKELGKTAEVLGQGAKELLFSKDNSAVIIVKNDQTTTVFDTKPSPVPDSKPIQVELPAAEKYFWFQDGTKHIVAVEKNLISIMDTDGTNKTSIFTGDFDSDALFSWPDGTRLVLSLNLNSRSNPLPNLYTIDLR